MYQSNLPLTPHNINKRPADELAVKQLNCSNNYPECYQSDHRYICKDNCCWKKDCKKLTATWLRKN